jgi:hypothetical protein
MRRGGGERRLFWEAFEKAYPVKATAVLLIAALVVVGCGREGSLSRALSKLNYDSLPAKAPRPTKPAEKLHAAATELKDLVAVESKRHLSKKQAEQAGADRVQIAAQLRALDRQFSGDRKKLVKLKAQAALGRLHKIQAKTTRLERSLQATLAQLPRSGQRAAVPAAKAAKLLDALSPQAPQQPLSTGFGTKDAKHTPASLSAGIAPAYTSPTATEPASDLPRTPEQSDLDDTPETKVTFAIHALAQKLDGDPVKIYGWVRNNIRYQPYYGVRKGADQTLAEKAGSDADQAALLIALLHDSGIHARFVQGTAELPAAKAANWLGVDPAAGQRLDTAPDILASGGVPTTQVRANGEFVRARFEHVWAEAYVPNDAYRGAEEQLGGKTWLPLDPSIKQNEFTRPVADFRALLTPAIEDWAHSFSEGAQAVGDYGIIAPPTAAMGEKTQALRDRLNGVLQDHGIDNNSTIDQVVGGTKIKAGADTYLPSTTPFRARTVSGELRTLPSSLNASVSVAVSGADPLSQPTSDADETNAAGFTFTAPTRDLANKRITLGYVPATETDAEIVDAYHGLLNAPTYAAALIPVLRVDGRAVARGHQAVSTGYTQKLTMTYRMPGFSPDVVENPVYVGSLSALTLALGPTSMPQVKARTARLSQLPAATEANILTDAHAGEIMSLLGTYYFNRNDGFEQVAAQTDGVDRNRLLSGGIVATATGVSYIAGFPVYARLTGLYMDVDEDTQGVVSKTGDEDVRSAYLRMAGINASMSESASFSETMGAQAVSTAELLRDAMARRAPILLIDKSNVGRLDQLANVPASVKQEITRAVTERDARVIVPASESSINGWTGVGYIVDEGSTIGYRISGGLNGGFNPVADFRQFVEMLGALQQNVREGSIDVQNKFWDRFEEVSPFKDCNWLRVGGLGGLAIIGGVFSYVLIGHLIGATFAIGGITGLPAFLIAGTGPAMFAAVFALALSYFLYALERCLDELDFNYYELPSSPP